MQKILVVGGTGMLTGLVKDLSVEAEVHVIARNLRKLELIAEHSDNIHPISVDYTDLGKLEQKLDGLCFDVVVSWIHSSQVAQAVVFVIAKHCRGDFFDVTGSEGRNSDHPSHIREAEIATLDHVRYHRVVLGSKGSNWLTDPEICEGIYNALKQKLPEFIVGE